MDDTPPHVAERIADDVNITFVITSAEKDPLYRATRFWLDTYEGQDLVWFDISRSVAVANDKNVYGYIRPDTARMIAYALLELADVADGTRTLGKQV